MDQQQFYYNQQQPQQQYYYNMPPPVFYSDPYQQGYPSQSNTFVNYQEQGASAYVSDPQNVAYSQESPRGNNGAHSYQGQRVSNTNRRRGGGYSGRGNRGAVHKGSFYHNKSSQQTQAADNESIEMGATSNSQETSTHGATAAVVEETENSRYTSSQERRSYQRGSRSNRGFKSGTNNDRRKEKEISQTDPEALESEAKSKSYSQSTKENMNSRDRRPRRGGRGRRGTNPPPRPGERWYEQGNYDEREYGYQKKIERQKSSDSGVKSKDRITETQETESRGEITEKSTDSRDVKGAKRTDSRKNQYKNRQKGRYNDYPRGRNAKNNEDSETQRGVMIEQLTHNSYECMVCCEVVRCEAAIWNCKNCFHVFHLRCIKKWARSPAAVIEEGSNGWRCPACQNVTNSFPNQYRCFCAKVRDPDWNRFETPHSCGEVCNKKRTNSCPHTCNILCHPGPCPPCHANITKTCDCGKTKKVVKCGTSNTLKCTENCGKTLNCGIHECKQVCHVGSCEACDVKVTQKCYCTQTEREATCGTTDFFNSEFGCSNVCNRDLDCGKHKCAEVCHQGACQSCPLLPQNVTNCPCGSTPLDSLTEAPRKSCIDPIPTCKKKCLKKLKCGMKKKPHFCHEKCHQGPCGPCQGTTEVTCRCGIFNKTMTCIEASQFSESKPFCCDKRCNKKRQCGRHKCSQTCCMDADHKCEFICGRKLTCGLHKCEEPCHRGNCPTCWQVSFDELTCHCGAEIMYPPIPCGTRPPECKRFCTRGHSCSHPIRHYCHSDEMCPPCTELTQKQCMGGHEVRKNIPCYLTDISCGLPCNRILPCEQHKCQLVCHKGDCVTEGELCKQLCQQKRPLCGHPCGTPCHAGETCPDVPCKAEVILKCKCGFRTGRAVCMQGGADASQEFQRMATSMLAAKVAAMQTGQSIDISSLTGEGAKKKQRQLECTEECAKMERNKRLALALEIKNPDLQGKLGNPQYTDFLKSYSKQQPKFVADIEKKFSDLVQSAQKSKQPKRSHAFPPMKSADRRVIHELAECYGCETQSYDEEPKKNVVMTAYKNKCWLPSVTLTSLTQRELHPKAPTPMPLNSREEDLRSAQKATLQSTQVVGAWGRGSATNAWASKVVGVTETESSPSPLKKNPKGSSMTSLGKTISAKKEDPVIDYFDMTD